MGDNNLTVDDVISGRLEWNTDPALLIVDLFRKQCPEVAAQFSDDERLFGGLRELIERGSIYIQSRGSLDDDDFEMRFQITTTDEEREIHRRDVLGARQRILASAH